MAQDDKCFLPVSPCVPMPTDTCRPLCQLTVYISGEKKTLVDGSVYAVLSPWCHAARIEPSESDHGERSFPGSVCEVLAGRSACAERRCTCRPRSRRCAIRPLH